MKKTSLVFLSALVCGFSYAKIWLPKIYSDNMLLQRDAQVKIRGTADANARIDVSFAGQKKSTKADANGNWSLKLDKMSANKTPQEMTISENRKIGKTIKNILVGEVWVAGGQSNMEWPIRNTVDGKDAVARAKYPNLRYFAQHGYDTNKGHNKQEESTNGRWIVADNNVGGWSAAGFYFAEKLMKDLDVPVGIVYASRGATSMIAWIPDERLNLQEHTKTCKAKFLADLGKYDYKGKLAKHNKKMADAKVEDEKRKAEGKPKATRPWDFHLPPLPNTPWAIGSTPSFMYNLLVYPVRGYTVRGVIWYQGEGDASGERCKNFEIQMKQVVDSWREAFENKNMYFYWAQLTSFKGKWQEARWRQLKARNNIHNSGVINIIDAGEKDNIHPKYKTEVGVRFEGLALREVYGRKDVYPYSPEFKSATYSDDTAKVSFNTFGRNLQLRGKARGFEVKVAGKWQNANATLSGNEVLVKSANGGKVEGVRYLWKGWADPDVCLYNQDDLPAFSFIDEK